MSQVQLVLVNNSQKAGNFIIFHRREGLGTPVAWFSKYAYKGMQIKFSWNQFDYCFVWGAASDVRPGTVLKAAQIVPADFGENRAVVLSYDEEHRTFYFKDERPDVQAPPFFIKTDQYVPSRAAAVGIGVADRITSMVEAEPNYNLRFDPRHTTWVTFGKPDEGEVLNLEEVIEPVQIEFRPNVNSLTVTLNADDSWTVKENIMMVSEEEEEENQEG